MLSRDEIIWGYRYILGRDPESEDVIERAINVADRSSFRKALLASEEFARISKQVWLRDCWILAPIFGGRRLMWLNLGDKYVSFGCLLDNYEPAATRFVSRYLRHDSVFLDIGANIGWFTMLASTIVSPEKQIHAFEPRPDTREHLEKSVQINDLKNVIVHNYGLFNETSSAHLNWSKNTDNPGGSFITKLPGGPTMESELVEVTTLDSLGLKRIDFVKLDVEGAEMRVLMGGKDTITRDRPIVLSELYPKRLRDISGATDHDFFEFFQQRDYRCFIVDVHREGEEIAGFPKDWPKDLLNIGFVPLEQMGSNVEGG